jgi:hypothetical protein
MSKFLTQQEKKHLRDCKNNKIPLTKEAKKNMFGKTYNPNFNYQTNK